MQGFDETVTIFREYPHGAVNAMIIGWVLGYFIQRLNRWYEKRREAREREWERRENERLDELHRRVYRPDLARRMAAERGCDPAAIMTRFERTDREVAAYREERLDDEAVERAAKERGCDATTLLARIAQRRDDY